MNAGTNDGWPSMTGTRRLLGHTNISATQRYMHLDEKELAEVQDLVDGRTRVHNSGRQDVA